MCRLPSPGVPEGSRGFNSRSAAPASDSTDGAAIIERPEPSLFIVIIMIIIIFLYFFLSRIIHATGRGERKKLLCILFLIEKFDRKSNESPTIRRGTKRVKVKIE